MLMMKRMITEVKLITPPPKDILAECRIGSRVESRITENKELEIAPLHAFKLGLSHQCILYCQTMQ